MKNKIMIVFAALIIALVSCSPYPLITGCKTSEHNIMTNSHFEILWSKPSISVYNDSFTPMLQGVNSVIVALIQNPDYLSSKVVTIDTLSGDLLWEKEITLPVSIATGNSSIYIGMNDKIEEYESSTAYSGEVAQ